MIVIGGTAQAQVGNLIWEEEFDDLDNWIKLTGNGSWGWGNGELEFYNEDNVDIAAVPGEPGNNALRITAKQESGPGIVDQWGNPAELHVGQGDQQVDGVRQVRHDRDPGADSRHRPGRLARGVAAGHRQLRLAPLRRDRHDGDGRPAGLPRSARHPQRRQRPGQLHRQPGRGRQRHLLLRRGRQPGESLGRRQPLLGSGRRLLPPLLQLRDPARRALPDLPAVLGRDQPALHRDRRRRRIRPVRDPVHHRRASPTSSRRPST